MSDIVNRLRGYYPVGPIQDNGEPEFGWRVFAGMPDIQLEAANQIVRLREALSKSADIVAEGYWHADQMDREDANRHIEAAEAIHAAGMWPGEAGPL